MYISKLIIKNYKSIKNEKFIFNKGINVLVGKNNSGKSNIVSALNEILGDRYNTTSYEDKTFYESEDGKIDKNFKIIAEVEELKNLDFSLLDNIKKNTGLLDITDYFDENDEEFENEWLLSDDDSLKEQYPLLFNPKGTNLLLWKKKDDLKEILNNTEKMWIYKYYNKDEDINIYSMVIKHKLNMGPLFPDQIVTKYYRMLFVNTNIKSTLITSLLIPAFRSTELTLKITKWTWYGKLLQKEWEKSCNEDHLEEIREASNKLQETVGKVYKEMKTDINNQLEKTLSLMNVKVDINMLESKSEDYYKNIHLSVDDGVETPIENKGSGLQSLLIIELFKFYCKVFNQSSLLILEEPELFLHPHAKRMLSEILKDFVDNSKNKHENQIILTSHSDEFISNVDIENINVIRKTSEGTKKSRIDKANYGDGKELQKLKIELQHKNAEMFFAEKVILVEGEEQILIPEIVKSIYKENILNNNDVSIVKVGGKSYFNIYRKVLTELNIDNYIIADYDIISNGLDSLLNDSEKQRLCKIREKMPETLKSNKKNNKETESRDWKKLSQILDSIIVKKQYDSSIDDVWANFRDRIYSKPKLEELDNEVQEEVVAFIEDMYKNNIFIMKNGELEDYYKENSFSEEFENISGKGIRAYKIAELASINGIENYMNIDEYKIILDKILCIKKSEDNT